MHDFLYIYDGKSCLTMVCSCLSTTYVKPISLRSAPSKSTHKTVHQSFLAIQKEAIQNFFTCVCQLRWCLLYKIYNGICIASLHKMKFSLASEVNLRYIQYTITIGTQNKVFIKMRIYSIQYIIYLKGIKTSFNFFEILQQKVSYLLLFFLSLFGLHNIYSELDLHRSKSNSSYGIQQRLFIQPYFQTGYISLLQFFQTVDSSHGTYSICLWQIE